MRDTQHLVENIDRYRQLLRGELSTVTRRTVEWLLVHAVHELAGLEAQHDSEADAFHGPELLWIARRAVAEAVQAQRAQYGGFQLYIARQDVLVLLLTQNFGPSFTDSFAFLRPDGRTACSRALASGRRVIIDDVANDELFAPHVPAALAAGFRAVQATPLGTEAGPAVAMLSTHFDSPRSFSPDELLEMDAHAGKVSRQLACAWG